jgi:hypothetical protein
VEARVYKTEDRQSWETGDMDFRRRIYPHGRNGLDKEKVKENEHELPQGQKV